MSRRNAKIFFPSKTFDDDLAAFVKLAADNRWAFSNVDFKQIGRDATEQRADRANHDSEEAKFNHLHSTFGLNQDARHSRFSSALDAARGAFKNDPAVLKQLERFKRSVRRGKKAVVTGAETSTASTTTITATAPTLVTVTPIDTNKKAA